MNRHSAGILRWLAGQKPRNHCAQTRTDHSTGKPDNDRRSHQPAAVAVEILDGDFKAPSRIELCDGSPGEPVSRLRLFPPDDPKVDQRRRGGEQVPEDSADDHRDQPPRRRSRVLRVPPHPSDDSHALQFRRCDQVTWPATDLPPGADRGHDFYCHWLPDGHDGPCEPFPTAARLATEWHRAYTTAKPRTRPAEVLA